MARMQNRTCFRQVLRLAVIGISPVLGLLVYLTTASWVRKGRLMPGVKKLRCRKCFLVLQLKTPCKSLNGVKDEKEGLFATTVKNNMLLTNEGSCRNCPHPYIDTL
jgi:hypothetical protein